MTLPKYSKAFFVFIISSKIIYLIFEVYYNGHLLDVISNSNITTESMKSIENLGHNISAIGITLLLFPVYYLITKSFLKKKRELILFSLILFSLISFFGFKSLLTNIMDDIVKSNSNKRYSSYYIAIFKYGMLNNYMGYETFIPKNRIQNLTVEDKIMVSNMFLLTLVDKTLVNKLVNNGSDIFTDLIIKQYSWNNYQTSKNAFEKKAHDIYLLYNKYIEKSKKINLEFKKVDSNDMFELNYQDFITNLREKYQQYNEQVIKYKNHRIPSNTKVKEVKERLERYFRYSHYQKAKTQYRNSMMKNFGRYIEPSRWLSKHHQYPTNYSVKKVIIEEADRQWKIRSGDLPSNLSEKEFYLHPIIKNKVINELKAKGLIVNSHFNYSKKMFYHAYVKKLDVEFIRTKEKFINEFKQISMKSLRFGLDYKQFLKYFKNDFTEQYGQKFGTILYNLILTHKIDNFYKSFYRPYFQKKELSAYLLSRKDFQKQKNHAKGDNAIKLLYIPPFAVGMSVFAGILNMVSLFVMLIFFLIPIKKLPLMWQLSIKTTLKISLLYCLIYYPYHIGKNSNILKPYSVLHTLKSEKSRQYIEFLYWLMVVEKYNYNHIYRHIKEYQTKISFLK